MANRQLSIGTNYAHTRLNPCNEELEMMLTMTTNLTPSLDMSVIDEFSHIARSTLNSIEYLTAVTLGLAEESLKTAAHEGEYIGTAKSPVDVTVYFSMSPVNLVSGFSKRCLQLQEATQNYYKYVNSDLLQMH